MKLPLLLFAILLVFASCRQEQESSGFFNFKADQRLFASFCFMNAAGFDHDWLDNMHPVRDEVRAFLDSILTEEYISEIEEYYNEHGGGNFYAYGASVLHLGNPPEFNFKGENWDFENIGEFSRYDSVLRKFYSLAHIEELWERYEFQLDSINHSYEPYARQAISQITEYCRVDSNFYSNIAGNIHYQQMPLMSHWTAFFCEVDNEYWIVRGPSTTAPGPSAFYHEALHRIVNPIVEQNPDITIKIDSLLPYAQEKLRGNYNSSTLVLCESFVRSIDKILRERCNEYDQDQLEAKIEEEYKLGHILCFYLFENLPQYESSGLSLEEYYPELMSALDVDHEINRWKAYWIDK